MRRLLCSFLIILMFSLSSNAQNMSSERLEEIITEVADTVQATGQAGCHGKIGIRVRSADSRFKPGGFHPSGEHAQSGGAIVVTPGNGGGSPGAFHQSFIAIDRGGKHG